MHHEIERHSLVGWKRMFQPVSNVSWDIRERISCSVSEILTLD